jgi:hypothetical protein
MVRRLFHECHAGMRDVVRGLTADELDWKPIEGANSIAVLVAHSLDSERFLVAAAADVTFDRDREAQFLVRGLSSTDCLALIDRVEAEVDGYLAAVRPDLLDAELVRGPRVHPGAWWLLHPLEHCREHLGQALLTRQLLEAQRS